MKFIKIIPMILAICLLLTLTGCGGETTTFALEDVVTVTVNGDIDGEASISVGKSSKQFHAITEKMFPDGYTDLDYARYEILFYEGIEIKVDGDTKNVSNGDEITVSAYYSEDIFKENGLVMNPKKFTYTVSGLSKNGEKPSVEKSSGKTTEEEATAAPVEVDIFEGMTIEYSGISGEAFPEINADNAPDYIKDNVKFNFTTYYSNVKNGDKIVVAGYTNSKEFTDNYTAKDTEKTFIVEGLPEYITTADGYDFADVIRKLDEEAEKAITEKYLVGDTWYTVEMLGKDKGNLGDLWEINNVEITPGDIYFWTPTEENKTKNTLSKYYLITLDMTKTKMAWNVDANKDGHQLGDTRSFTIPFVSYVHNLYDKDGAVNTGNAKWKWFLYNRYDYVCDDLPGIIEHWIEINPEFEYTKITQ
jgi:hypothetical protein